MNKLSKLATSNKKKFIDVANALAAKISTMQSGDKLPTACEISEQFSITIATASKVIKELKNRGLIISKPGLGSRVAKLSANQYILLVDNSESQHGRMFLNNLITISTKSFQHCKILSTTDNNLQDEITNLKDRSQIIGGIIFFRDIDIYQNHINFAKKMNIPTLFFGSNAYTDIIGEDPAVLYDEVEIIATAMRKLYRDKSSKIGCLYNSHLQLDIMRHNLYQIFLKNMGLKVDEKCTIDTGGKYFAYLDNVMADSDKRLKLHTLFTNIDSILVFHDQQAVILMQYIKELGFSIPEDISVISIDNLDICILLRPTLSSVHIDISQGAKSCLDFFNYADKNLINFKKFVPVYLVERDSSKII